MGASVLAQVKGLVLTVCAWLWAAPCAPLTSLPAPTYPLRGRRATDACGGGFRAPDGGAVLRTPRTRPETPLGVAW